MGLFDRWRRKAKTDDNDVASSTEGHPWTEADEQVVRDAVDSLARIGFRQRRPIAPADLLVCPDVVVQNPEWRVLQARDEDLLPYLHRVFDYDAEFIDGDDAYPRLIRDLVTATEQEHLLGDVSSQLDDEAGAGWISYTFDGRTERVDVEVDGDWADGTVVGDLIPVFGAPGCREVCRSSGQGGTYYWVPDEHLDTFRSFVPAEELGDFIF